LIFSYAPLIIYFKNTRKEIYTMSSATGFIIVYILIFLIPIISALIIAIWGIFFKKKNDQNRR